MRIFIGASSSEKVPQKYMDDCEVLLNTLLKDDDLVFGAYDKGLLGLSYRIAKKNNRKIIGICPEAYKESLDNISCDEYEITKSIIDSTNKIYHNSDVIIILPGGYGCLYELLTANYCKICNEISTPIILYNSCGYYDRFISLIDDMYNDGFIKETEMNKYIVSNNIDDIKKTIDELKR